MPTREQEIAMMTQPEHWPQRPQLPLKKVDGIFEPSEGFAILVDHPIKGFLWFPCTAIGADLNMADAKPVNPEKLYDAGWRVD